MNSSARNSRLSLREMAIFAMFGTLMLISKKLMEFAPNVHLLGMFTVLLTLCYRAKALIPLYLYVFLNGLIEGFNLWWFPYLYIWTVLWGMTMLLPVGLSSKVGAVVYPLLCALHGFAFGTLYAPAQALIFGFGLEETLAWITAGLPWDVIHALGNLGAGMLVLPLYEVMKRIDPEVKKRSFAVLTKK